jgi:Ring finger domain
MTMMNRIVHNNVSSSLSDWVHQVWIPLLTGIKPSLPSEAPIQTCASAGINAEADSNPSSASCSSSFKVSPQSLHVSKSQLEHASLHTMTQPNILEYLGMTTTTTSTAVDHHYMLLAFLTCLVALWSMILRAISWLRRRSQTTLRRNSHQAMTLVQKRTRRIRQSLRYYSKTLSMQDQIVSASSGSSTACESMPSSENHGVSAVDSPNKCLDLTFHGLEENSTVVMWKLPGPGLRSQQTERLVSNFCAICHGSFLVGNQVSWSSNPDCRHCFHVDCIVAWLLVQRSNRQCPCCRQVFHPRSGSTLDERSFQALEDRRRSH